MSSSSSGASFNVRSSNVSEGYIHSESSESFTLAASSENVPIEAYPVEGKGKGRSGIKTVSIEGKGKGKERDRVERTSPDLRSPKGKGKGKERDRVKNVSLELRSVKGKGKGKRSKKTEAFTNVQKMTKMEEYFKATAASARETAREMLAGGAPASEVQQFISNYYSMAVDALAKEAIHRLSERGMDQPCKFAIVGLGSLAKEEASPFSDLDFAILVEEDQPENRAYFQTMLTEMNRMIELYGETDRGNRGFALCQGELNPPYEMIYHDGMSDEERQLVGSPHLLSTPEELARISTSLDEVRAASDKGAKPKIVFNSLLFVGQLAGDKNLLKAFRKEQNRLFSEPCPKGEAKGYFPDEKKKRRKQRLRRHIRALELFRERSADLKKVERLRGQDKATFDVKRDMLRSIQSVVMGLSVYYGIQEPNTMRAIDRLVEGEHMDPKVAKKLKKYIL